MCTPMFFAALLTLARTWKQPRWPSTDEWVKTLCIFHMHSGKLAIKRNSFESVPMRWMNLEPIIRSEGSQKEKDKHIYIESGKTAQMNLSAGQQWRQISGEWACGRGVGWEELRVYLRSRCIAMHGVGRQVEICCVMQGAQN